MMWGWGDGWVDAGGVVMIVVMLAVLALIVLGIVFLVRGVSRATRGDHYSNPAPGPGPTAEPSARDALRLLEERYARGEIDREDFLRRRQDLLGG